VGSWSDPDSPAGIVNGQSSPNISDSLRPVIGFRHSLHPAKWLNDFCFIILSRLSLIWPECLDTIVLSLVVVVVFSAIDINLIYLW